MTLDDINAMRYPEFSRQGDSSIIRTSGNQEVSALDASRRVALRKLLVIDAAASLQDLREVPGNRLENLRGNRKGQYSVRIYDQWQICFRWEDGDALDVEIVDYH